jgi:restriction endonuclease S subunit
MSKYTSYECQLCDTTFAQKEHHKNHIKSKAHKQEEKIKKLELEKLSEDELMETYNNNNISKIIKKLSKNKINTITKIQNENTNFNNFGIGTKEAMKDKVHSIHNFLRNNGAGYGMNALKLFNLFYGLAKIEKNGHFENTELDECCKFSNILKEFKNNNEQGLEYLKKNTLKNIHSNKILKKILLFPIPEGISSPSLYDFLIMINELCEMEDKLNFQLAGKIYEYFIGRDQTAISELGAYFTDRHIINYIYEKLLNPTLNDDGNVKTMIDMFGGSGGFTLGYLNYLNQNNNIDWKEQLKNIYHYDMNIDVVKYAMLEMYCITGEFPNSEQVNSLNSFTNEFGETDKFNYIITNPPYGGDKITKTEEKEIMKLIKKQIETYFKTTHKVKNMKQVSTLKLNEKDKNKVKQYDIVYKKLKEIDNEVRSRTVQLNNSSLRFQNYAKNNDIDISKCKDKEAVSFLMMMEMLKKGGTAIGVLKEGLFFDSKYQHLRKHLVENFNVEKIVSIDASQFENTTTKTSIIMFHNNGKTDKIKFYDMIINKENKTELIEQEDGTFKLNTIKNRIINVSDQLITTATYNNIVKEDYTFNHKKYNKVELVPGDSFEMVRLGDICEFLPKSKRNASFGKSYGKYPFYTSSEKVKYCDVADYNKLSLIIGDGGNANIHIDNNYSCSDHHHLIHINDKNKIYYIYNLFKSYMDLLKNGFSGSVIKNISKKYLQLLQLPIPKDEKQLKYWVNYISEPYNLIQECKTKLQTLEEQVKQDIQNILDNNEIEEVMLGDLCEFIKSGKDNKNVVNNIDNKYKYTYYVSGGKKGYVNEGYLNSNIILSSRVGAIGNIFLPDKYFNASSNILIIKLKTTIKINIIYYILLNYNYNNITNGSVQKLITLTLLKKIKIQLPKDRSILNTLNPVFEEIDSMNAEIPKQEELYNSRLEELRKASIKE